MRNKTNLSGGGQDSDDILCVIWMLELLSDTYAGRRLVLVLVATGSKHGSEFKYYDPR